MHHRLVRPRQAVGSTGHQAIPTALIAASPDSDEARSRRTEQSPMLLTRISAGEESNGPGHVDVLYYDPSPSQGGG